MDPKEWQAYVEKVAKCQFPVPMELINDYEDWRCRSIVGRMLLVLDDVEGAIAILSTVKDIKPNLEDVPENGLSEAEHKVLCLRDIAEIVYKLTGTTAAPIVYLDEANHWCRAYQHPFRGADRGAIWYRRQELLLEAGQNERAMELAEKTWNAEKAEVKVNPYAFYAAKFLAEQLAAQGDYTKAALLLEAAYQYYPENADCKQALAAAGKLEDAAKRYEAYHKCTTISYEPWEKRELAVVDRH